MRTKTVCTARLNYAKRIRILAGEYEDGSLYVGLYTMQWEDYCDITTHLLCGNGVNTTAYVECGSEAEAFLCEQGIATPTMLTLQQGFNTYRLYDFSPLLNDPKLKEVA